MMVVDIESSELPTQTRWTTASAPDSSHQRGTATDGLSKKWIDVAWFLEQEIGDALFQQMVGSLSATA